MEKVSATKKYVHFEHFTVITGRKGNPIRLWNTTTYDINNERNKEKYAYRKSIRCGIQDQCERVLAGKRVSKGMGELINLKT